MKQLRGSGVVTQDALQFIQSIKSTLSTAKIFNIINIMQNFQCVWIGMLVALEQV